MSKYIPNATTFVKVFLVIVAVNILVRMFPQLAVWNRFGSSA